ncbi:DIP1984 family protein [Clostridium sp. AN503]|uniref:DIP1984 family protein n=1 Tax=Clostridium sp. AN503 TaxID=3160598 RepID=UPI00345767A3
MKLAEALSLRADLQKRLAQLRVRLVNNAKVQEGELPSEAPEDLLAELDEGILLLEKLIRNINRTNCGTVVDGVSLTDMIAKRDALALKNSILQDFVKCASEKFERYSSSEIRIKSTVNVSQMQKETDRISKEMRELDVKIQGLNWTTELIED